MRKIFFLSFVISCLSLFSQNPPQLINYQGIARDAAGNPMLGQSINLVFNLYQNPSGGTAIYTESATVVSNSITGVFTHQIGSVSSLASVAWASGPYFMEVTINGNVLPRQQLLSVPYALYAPPPAVSYSGSVLSIGGNTVSITTTPSNLNGDVTGSIGSNTISSIQNIPVNAPSPSSGQVLSYNGSAWVPSNLAASTITLTGSGLVNVSPTTGNSFSISVPSQSLSISGSNVLSSNLGGSVVLPLTTITPSTGISVTGSPTNGYTLTNTSLSATTSLASSNTNIQLVPGLNSYTLNAYTYSLTKSSNSITLSNGAGGANSTITIPTYSAGANMGLSGTTFSTPTYSLSFSSSTLGTLTNGLSSTSVTIPPAAPPPTPTISGSPGIVVGGAWPSITLNTAMTGSNGAAWNTLGNTGTNPPTNFLGTTDVADLVFKTNNNSRAVINGTSGNVGIGFPPPSPPISKLHVNGQVTIQDLNQGDGKVLVSDMNGSGTWKSSPPPIVSTVGLNVSSYNLSGASVTCYTLSISKIYANTHLDIKMYSNVNPGAFTTATAVKLELYLDGSQSPFSTIHEFQTSGQASYVSLNSIFEGITIGSHVVSIVATPYIGSSVGGISNSFSLDPGGYGGKILVKEIF